MQVQQADNRQGVGDLKFGPSFYPQVHDKIPFSTPIKTRLYISLNHYLPVQDLLLLSVKIPL